LLEDGFKQVFIIFTYFMPKKILSIFLVAVLITSCRKDDSPVGKSILPQSDIIGAQYAEFYPNISYSHFGKSDSVLLTTRLSNSALLGSLNDPIFGRTDASIYCSFETQYYLGNLNENLPYKTASLDSAVLILGYNYVPGSSTIFVGDTTDQLSLDIFPLTANLNPDTNYYSTGNNYYYTGTDVYSHGPIPYDANKSLIYGGQSKTFTPHLLWFTPLKKDTDAYNPPQIRVRLRTDFSEGLFGCINNNTLFQQYLKGMFITTKHSILPQPSYGSLFFLYMDGNTSITFYYHVNGIPDQQPPIQCFCNGATCNRFSYFKHDYSIASPDLKNQLSSPDTLATNNHNKNVYLQGAGGVSTILKFPGFQQWANINSDYNITINKAELVLSTDRSNTDFYDFTRFPLPGRVYLEGDTLGGPAGLVENLYTFGGYYDLYNNQYLIEMPHTIGQIVNHKTFNTKYYLTVYNGALFPERLVLGGTANKEYPIKLRVWYTKLPIKK
jgi:uncharacterized protein DUF4270